MARVSPFKPADYLEINRQVPMLVDNPAHLALLFYNNGPAYTVWLDNDILACGGMVIPWAGLGHVWAVLAPLALEHTMIIHRIAKRQLHSVIKEHGLRRVEATVMKDFEVGQEWLYSLGFVYDGFAEAYGPNGEDFFRYVLLT